MGEVTRNRCVEIAFRQSLVFATVGLLAALLLVMLMFGFEGATGLLSRFVASVAASVVALYAAAASLGIVAGGLFRRHWARVTGTRMIGIGLAWSCLFISALAGSSVLYFSGAGDTSDVAEAFGDYVVKPVFWVMVFGTVPAIVLGLLYGAQVRRKLDDLAES